MTHPAPAPGAPQLAQVLCAGPLAGPRLEGARFGPWVVEGELGRGAFGVVLRARDAGAPGPGQEVALKVLLGAGQASEGHRRRLAREAELTRALRHPGIVEVLDAGTRDGLDYVAYALVRGRTLEAENQAAPRPRRLDLLAQVARAMAHAHAHDVIHRDLKPANVLVREADGRALVADFGLARDVAHGSSLTATGAALGTPAYMAPEQLGGKDATPAADVFALGVMLYEALTGRLPYPDASLPVRFAAVLTGRFDPPSKVAPDVPRAYDEVVRRALAPRPEDRYPDAAAFAAALDQARGVAPAGEAGAGPPARGPDRRLALLVGGLLALALALGGAGLAALAAARAPRPAAKLPPRASPLEEALAALEAALAAADPPWPTPDPWDVGPAAAPRKPDAAARGLARRAAALADALQAAGAPSADTPAAPGAGPAPVADLHDRARLALAAAHLVAGRTGEAEAALADVAAAPGARPPPALGLARALTHVVRGRPALAAPALRAPHDPAPFPAAFVEEGRARALLAGEPGPDDLRAARAALDAALAGDPKGAVARPRLVLRARARLALGDEPGALDDLDAAIALEGPRGDPAAPRGPALEDALRARVAAARAARAERTLDRPGALGAALAAQAVADLRAALAEDARAPGTPPARRLASPRLGRAAQAAGLTLLARAAAPEAEARGSSAPDGPPDVEAVRAALALLELAPHLDPALPAIAPGVVEAALALCRRDDCPPAARFQVAAAMRRARVPLDMRRELRLDAPDADFAAEELRLAGRVVEADGDPARTFQAYRSFCHFVRRVPALVPVCWEAEEDALTRLPLDAPGRFHALVARLTTLKALKRAREGRPLAAEAIRLAEAAGDPSALADVLYWTSSHASSDRRHEDALAQIERALALYATLGKGPKDAWWVAQHARCLGRVGRHAEGLAALAAGRKVAKGSAERATLDKAAAALEKAALEAERAAAAQAPGVDAGEAGETQGAAAPEAADEGPEAQDP